MILNECGLPSPLISIVIPTWNLESWRVRNCLWSLRQQTEQNIEAIISDINSDAEHLKELRQLATRFDATLIHNKRHVWSIAFAYNAGLRLCRGRCAATIDADVIFEPKVIEDTLKIFKGDNRQIVVRQPSFLGVGVDCSSLKFPASYSLLSMQTESYIAPSVGSFFCAPMTWWNKVHGYDEGFEMYALEDWEIWRRAGKDRMRKVFIGKKSRFPLQPPREGCKLYHQPHPPFRIRTNTPEETYEEYRRRNQLLYSCNPTLIVRNDEDWGLVH